MAVVERFIGGNVVERITLVIIVASQVMFREIVASVIGRGVVLQYNRADLQILRLHIPQFEAQLPRQDELQAVVLLLLQGATPTLQTSSES